MTFLREAIDGSTYVCINNKFGGKTKAKYRNWFIASRNGEYYNKVFLGKLIIPQELSGKKFRLKVEIIKEIDEVKKK